MGSSESKHQNVNQTSKCLKYTLPSNPNMAICSNSSILASNSASAIFTTDVLFIKIENFTKKVKNLKLRPRTTTGLLLNVSKQISSTEIQSVAMVQWTHFGSSAFTIHTYSVSYAKGKSKKCCFLFLTSISYYSFQRKWFFEHGLLDSIVFDNSSFVSYSCVRYSKKKCFICSIVIYNNWISSQLSRDIWIPLFLFRITNLFNLSSIAHNMQNFLFNFVSICYFFVFFCFV